MKYRRDKKFKIVQFTDTHIVAGDSNSVLSIKTIELVLDIEKPDLVVFTGDLVVESSIEKGWEMVTQPVIIRKIPFAVVLGNHDDESYLNRQAIAENLEAMPYSLVVSKTPGVTGNGNYIVSIRSSWKNTDATLLYFIDSNAYVNNNPDSGYNWIQTDQIAWYRNESEHNKKLHNGVALPALAFFHIPLPEFYQAYINEAFPPVGLRLEKECSPGHNSGMFDAFLHSGDVMGVFCGHDHDNDYVSYLKGIALAYGRFTGSKTTYGILGNGARIIELTEGQRSFRTWIRTGGGELLCLVKFPENFVRKK